MIKLSLPEIKKTNPKKLLQIIQKAKDFLKKDSTMQKICQEYDQPVENIDYIPTYFAELDINGKTDHGIVWLNYLLLNDNNFSQHYSYLIHEYNHYFQQCFEHEPTKSSDEDDYLSNKFEQESFQHQISYIANNHGIPKAKKYTYKLLNHHDKSGLEKKKLEKILLKKIK